MDALKVNILNPKAVKLLKDLADLDLISIQNMPVNKFEGVLMQLRKKAHPVLSLEDITKEVESVRSKRYVK